MPDFYKRPEGDTMGKKSDLFEKIEKLRKELHQLINRAEGYNMGKILETSMKLDALINEYLRLDGLTGGSREC